LWVCARALVSRDRLWDGTPRPHQNNLDYLPVYVLIGTLVGLRLGFVLLELAIFLNLPLSIAVWDAGGGFHSFAIGACAAIWIFAWRNGFSFWTVADICAPGAAAMVLFIRLVNFIKPDLWGRPTNVPWAMVFPGAGPMPRHPSQLYKAGLEGVFLFAAMMLAIHYGALKRPGMVAGIFGIGYGVARIFCEFFREPEYTFPYGITVGMVWCVPMILLSAWIIRRALHLQARTPEGKRIRASAGDR
jgi:phosphatidylglycerol:prolipoprotein diacylglycerol transferase